MRGIVAIDSARLRRYRLERVRAELRARDYAGVVFADAINLRYATDARNMQIWTLRNPARYVFIATDGPVVMFEFAGCHHLAKDIETIDEIRTATGWFYFTSGPRVPERAQKWAAELADLVQRHGGGNRRLAMRSPPWASSYATAARSPSAPAASNRPTRSPACASRSRSARKGCGRCARRSCPASARTRCGRFCIRPTSRSAASISRPAC